MTVTSDPPTYDGAFTVDVEDYFHVSAFVSSVRPCDWGRFPCRVEASTHKLLDLAEANDTRGTFFVLGWVAEHYPQLVTEIQQAGHEVGCHSHAHQLVYELGADGFRQDLVRARDTLESIIGQPVTLYRAPSFSITSKSLWALQVLREEGFQVDSSIYPIRHDRYGIPGAPVMPHLIETPAGEITEFPGMVFEAGRTAVPVGGGGYLRLLPWMVTERLLGSVRKQGRPLNVYVHPWEVDPDQPRIACSFKSRFRHYQNLRSTMPKLQKMLKRFRLTTMSEVLTTLELPRIPSVIRSSPEAPRSTDTTAAAEVREAVS